MDEVASTRAEANVQLQRLREAREIKGDYNDISSNVLASSLSNALDILSKQLYSKPTHFLLDLIQNADDNTFPSESIPRLHFSLYQKHGKGVLRSDCNEIGFTFQQLDALTQIGKSTKKAADGRKEHIGEKGIGFKSVFKVADLVHVASGCYEFKFNGRKPIGMMLPISSTFPRGDRVKDHTQFLLHLKRNKNYEQIRDDLRRLESEVLLFLQNLEQLDVTINDKCTTYKLRTESSSSKFGGETAIVSEDTDQQTKTITYMIERQAVEDLPSELRRKAVSSSDVVVAFPVKDETTPIVRSQQVFAFFPVQNYGFKTVDFRIVQFLVHADFLLTASRESLEEHCPWNLALRNGIQDTVVEAICSRFLDLDEDEDGKGLCYSWPLYLTRQPNGAEFWNALHDNILDALTKKKILKSRDRQAARSFQKPGVVRHVPMEYRFEGETLFDLPSINKTHLSFAYDHVYEPLCSLGVSQLCLSDLCEEFCQWVGHFGAAGLKERPDEWHNRVAEIFQNQGESIRQKLKRLPIIPLRNGSWVTATETHLYFPSPDKNEHVPNGINISIVAQNAVRNVSRRKLYEYLDIKVYNPSDVCKLILELHGKLLPSPWIQRSTKELVDDAMYLFKHRYIFWSGLSDFIFLVHKDGKLLAQRSGPIYIIDPKSEHCAIAKYKDTPGNPFCVLFKGYEAEFLKTDAARLLPDFREWLLQYRTTFSTIPGLVRNSVLTPEWEFLCEKNVWDLLHVVQKYLSSTLFKADVLLEAVRGLKVPCLDGESRALSNLAFPTLELKCHCPHLDFANLSETALPYWEFLSQFGVVTERSTTAILRELQALRRISVGDVDASAIREVYEALNSDTRTSEEQVLRAFESEPLVFILKPEPRWLSHKDCVWAAPKLLNQVTELRSYYGNCETLFCFVLGVKDAEIQHVVDEFCRPASTEGDYAEQRFKEMLSLLSQFHRNCSLSDGQIRKIRAAPVFPILVKGSSPTEGLSRIKMHSLDDKDCYVPNIKIFEAAFRGKVNILALPVQSVREMEDLFKHLGCGQEFLSAAVKQIIKANGPAVRNFGEEQDLRTRLRYIYQVLAEGGSNQDFPDISSIRVWSVPSITLTMSLDGVEVAVDDLLIAIATVPSTKIEISLREGVHQFGQTEVTYELVKHFKQKIGFDESFTGLVSLLMGAPIHSLPGILDKHWVPLPEGSHVGVGSGEETPDP